jgi:beta-galactosidase
LIRRDFIKTAGAVLASTALPRSKALADEQSAQGRMILPINRNWRYHPAKVEGAEAVAFDDSKFARVVLPHTNIALPWHSFDDKDYEFISTYRRRFKLPEEAAGKRVFVDFEGAMTASTVWINGILLGEYKGGFTPFSFELTKHLRPQDENVLTVQLDSTERADIPPFGYEIDYMTFGGIYREVSLRIVPAVFIDNIFAQPKDVMSGNPSLDVNCFIAGDLTTSAAITIEAELHDGEKVIAKASRPIEQ